MKTVTAYQEGGKWKYACPGCGLSAAILDLDEGEPLPGEVYRRTCKETTFNIKIPESPCSNCSNKDYPGAMIKTDKNFRCIECGKMIKPGSSSHSRGQILQEALETINGKRQDQYGDPEDSFELIADYWDVYITEKIDQLMKSGSSLEGIINFDFILTPKDVAMMMALLKIARESHQHKRDNLRDAAGYLGIAGDMEEE